MTDRWKELNQLDADMARVKSQKTRVENEIQVLQRRIQNLDVEFEELHGLWLFAGKEQYGSAEFRESLIQKGSKSDMAQIRQAAHTLKIKTKNIKFEDDVKEEMIRICIFIERGTRERENWNIKSILVSLGKLGYGKYDEDSHNEY